MSFRASAPFGFVSVFYLGTEWDWAVRLGDGAAPTGSAPDAVVLHPTVAVQRGHALLSVDQGGGRADLLMVVGQVVW